MGFYGLLCTFTRTQEKKQCETVIATIQRGQATLYKEWYESVLSIKHALQQPVAIHIHHNEKPHRFLLLYVVLCCVVHSVMYQHSWMKKR